jgi:hypothetical protein
MPALSRSQLVVRALIVLASLALVALSFAVAPQGILVLAVVLVALTAYAATHPESWLVTLLLVGLVLEWLATVPVPSSLGQWLVLLVAAWCGLVVHLTASLAASLPGAAPIPAATVRRWLLRGATVGAVVVPVWALAAVSALQAVPGTVGLTYAALAGIGLLSLGVWLLGRERA